MKRVLSVLVFSIAALMPSAAMAQQVTIMGFDNSFLGAVDVNKFDDISVCNQFTYGSQFTESIFNRFGVYGGISSPYGAYNPLAEKPPILIEDGQFVAYISKNRRLNNRIDPDAFYSQFCLRS